MPISPPGGMGTMRTLSTRSLVAACSLELECEAARFPIPGAKGEQILYIRGMMSPVLCISE